MHLIWTILIGFIVCLIVKLLGAYHLATQK